MNILREKQRCIGAHRLQCSSAPDTSGLNAAAVAQSGVAKDALDFYKQQYADQAPLRLDAANRANAVSDAELDAMKTQTGIAQQADQFRKNTFQPLEQDIVSKAQNYDTEGNRERLAGLALTDVNEQGAAARGQEERAMAARGVNPADGAYAAEATQRGNALTLAGANAKNQERTQATTMGHAMEMDAAGLGRNLPSNQATAAGLAINAGNASVNNAGLPLSQAQSAVGMMGQGYGTAINANNSAGNLYGTIGNIQNTANNSGNAIFGALGQAAGGFAGSTAGSNMIAGFLSDKKSKKNVKAAPAEISLAAIKKLPVSQWQYKRGRGDGGAHTGPMAQDVRARLGDAAAPGGKMIDAISLHGHTINAVKALDKKITALANARPKATARSQK